LTQNLPNPSQFLNYFQFTINEASLGSMIEPLDFSSNLSRTYLNSILSQTYLNFQVTINEASLGSMIEPQHVKLELGSLNSTVVSEEQTFTFNPGKPNLLENPGKFNLT
jgi:hypothetical protein